MKSILLFPFTLLGYLFGQFNWAPPKWLSAINSGRKNKPQVFWGSLGLMLVVLVGYVYYQSLPKDITVKAQIQSPGITQNYENAEPDKLYIEFAYDFSKLNANQKRPRWSALRCKNRPGG